MSATIVFLLADWASCLFEVQWHKLREAWRLMEAGEARDSAQFEVVAKLRFDCVPVQAPRLCPSQLEPSRGLTLHAASDKVFWGSV